MAIQQKFMSKGGTVITSGDTGTITSAMIADGAIVNNDISSTAAIAVSKLSASTISGVTLGSNLNTLTISTGLTGTSYNGSGSVTIAIDSTVTTLTGTQTLTNKTLTSPTITTGLTAGSSTMALFNTTATTVNAFGAATSTTIGSTTGTTTVNNTLVAKSYRETRTDLATGSAIDLSTGNFFSKTLTAATTFSVSNVPTTGTAIVFVLDLTNGGAYTITWWSGIKWAGGTAPTLTSTGRDVLVFFTYDGGTTWSGLVSKNIA